MQLTPCLLLKDPLKLLPEEKEKECECNHFSVPDSLYIDIFIVGICVLYLAFCLFAGRSHIVK